MFSQANLEIIREWYDTHNHELLNSQCIWEIAEGFPSGGTYVGSKAIFDDFFPNLLKNFASFQADVSEIVNAENMVVALGHYKGVTQKTQIEVNVPFVHLWKVNDGTIVWFRNYADTLLMARALI